MLVEWLPAESARHRAMNDGVQWTDLHALMNLVEFRLRENTAATINAAGGKASMPKHNPKPWVKPTNVLGDSGGRSDADVMAYLDSLAPE